MLRVNIFIYIYRVNSLPHKVLMTFPRNYSLINYYCENEAERP